MIVFCGVEFMAESAYILNPKKTVLIPSQIAKCPLAATIDVASLRELRVQYPDVAVVSHINTRAELKAESDICCTSANAIEVVNSLAENEVIFVPDFNLAEYVMRYSDKKIIPWNGWCRVHNKFISTGIIRTKTVHPDAKVLVHPEYAPEVIDLADAVCSTSGMINYVKKSQGKKFIIATEAGLIERLRLEMREKVFFQAPPGGICPTMKKINLRLVLDALETEQFIITVPENIRIKAKKALDRMLKVERHLGQTRNC